MTTQTMARRATTGAAARIALTLDGVFLLGVGLLQVALEVLGHWRLAWCGGCRPADPGVAGPR